MKKQHVERNNKKTKEKEWDLASIYTSQTKDSDKTETKFKRCGAESNKKEKKKKGKA